VDLFEALEEDKRQHGTHECLFCMWIESLPSDEQSKWDKAFARPSKEYSLLGLVRVARQRGFTGGDTVGKKHRNEKHRQEGVS
jgi:hypothetical protein